MLLSAEFCSFGGPSMLHSLHPTSATSSSANELNEECSELMSREQPPNVSKTHAQLEDGRHRAIGKHANEFLSSQRGTPSSATLEREANTRATQSSPLAAASEHNSPIKNASEEHGSTAQWDVEQGFVMSKLEMVRKYGIIDVLVMLQMILALFSILSSLSLSVAGVSSSWTFFIAGTLMILPLVPVVACLAIESPQAPLTFQILTQISAGLNIFWALVTWLSSSTSIGRVLLLFLVSSLQYLSLCLFACYKFTEDRVQCIDSFGKEKLTSGEAIEQT